MKMRGSAPVRMDECRVMLPLPRHRRCAVVAMAILAALALVVMVPARASAQANGRLQIHFMNVGEGDAAVLISPRGEVVLFDTGVAGQCGAPIAYLQSLGIGAIDYHRASSYRSEHIGCAADVFGIFGAPRIAFDGAGADASTVFSRYPRAVANPPETT